MTWDFVPGSDNQDASITTNYADPESGIAAILVSCDGGPDVTHPAGSPLVLTVRSADTGCTGYGYRYLSIRARNGAGLETAPTVVAVQSSPTFSLAFPLPAITGRPFTVTPVLPADVVLPATMQCTWEFRWGNDRSLDLNEYDETFGSLLFAVPPVNGRCAPWTFTLPWVPYPQFEVHLHLSTLDPSSPFNLQEHRRFMATVEGTNRLIASSSLPIAQVLPSTYTPVVGVPITYTRYLIGGAVDCCRPEWNAWLGTGDSPKQWYQSGGSTFTITPTTTGNLVVQWHRGSGDYRLAATYDPPVRYRDTAIPNTTPPVQRVGLGQLTSAPLVTFTWTGTDTGWGIDRYQLQRSVDGGPWKSVATTRAKTYTHAIATGHGYRYRVRAIDKYGNVGAWDYGQTFRPQVFSEGSTRVTYRGTWQWEGDPTAHGGSVRAASAANASATFTFTGRDVAWIAERGPTRGRAKVYVDGAYVTTVDLWASGVDPRRVVFRRHWSGAGTHTLRIVVVGTPGRPSVTVDAFVVLR